jgi:hypothetical protein
MKVFDFRISIILIVMGVLLFVISSQDVCEVQVPVTYYLYQSSGYFEAVHNWKVETTVGSGASITYGPFNAYYEGSDVIVLMLQASAPILVEVYGKSNGVVFCETSKNFTGTGSSGLWIGIWPNDTYKITVFNTIPSPQFVSGEIAVGRIVQENTPIPYTTYYTKIEYGPLYSSRFIWLIITLIGIAIGITTFCMHELYLRELFKKEH